MIKNVDGIRNSVEVKGTQSFPAADPALATGNFQADNQGHDLNQYQEEGATTDEENKMSSAEQDPNETGG